MSISPNMRRAIRHELDALRGDWIWFLVLGIALMVLGFVAVGAAAATTLVTVIFLGVMLLAAGAAESVGAFWSREWSGFFLHLLSGLLSIVIGIMFLRAPVNAELVLTMLIAAFLIVGGLFRMIAALSSRFDFWIWAFLGGLIDLVLGILIWAQWPYSGLWVIGLFVGINLLFRGANWIAVALAVRSIPKAPV